MNIFLTGANGYIGAAVARRLIAAHHDVTGLVRRPETARSLEAAGIAPLVGSLDDASLLREAARAADALINTADADHAGAVAALAEALAGSGKPFIHTSGSSLVGDRAAGEPAERVYTEDAPPPPARPEMVARAAINQRVIDSVHAGVRPIVIVPSMVYGGGRSVQLPRLIEQSAKAGAGVHIGRGLNRWSNVHLDDLADLYLLALTALAERRLSPGETFYVGDGEASLRDIAAAISRMLGFGGATVSWTLDEASRVWGDFMADMGLANNSRISSEKARRLLGWRPRGGPSGGGHSGGRVDLLTDVESGSYAARYGRG
jgi:nucleoside-diphosphate-sugar epimerase